jgi:uncharacterized protein YceK
MRSLCLVLAAAGLLAGCSTTQRLTVRTEPPGATVSLARIGVKRAEGDLPRMGGMALFQSVFQDPFEPLGTAPLTTTIELSQPLSTFRLPDGGEGEVFKETRAAIVRAVKDDRSAETRVRFTGEPLEVILLLSPERSEPAAPPDAPPDTPRDAPPNTPPPAPPDTPAAAGDQPR